MERRPGSVPRQSARLSAAEVRTATPELSPRLGMSLGVLHFGVQRRELAPDRARKPALWPAPPSSKLCSRPALAVLRSSLRGLLLCRAGAQGPQKPGGEAEGLPPTSPRLSGKGAAVEGGDPCKKGGRTDTDEDICVRYLAPSTPVLSQASSLSRASDFSVP